MKKLAWLLSVICVVLVILLTFKISKVQSEEAEEEGGGVDVTCSCLPNYCYSVYADPPFDESDGGNNKYQKGTVYSSQMPNQLR